MSKKPQQENRYNMTTNLAKYDNSWYKPGPLLKRASWYCVNNLFFKSGLFPFYALKRSLLRLFGAKVGKGVLVKPYVNIKYPWLLRMGNDIWIGEQVWIDNLGMVTIEDNVCISQAAFLLTGNHNYKKDSFDLMVKPITICEGAWIGAKSIVCPGVVCNEFSVLNVGSVAITDLVAYGIYSGNPAVKIKDRIFES